MAKKGLPTPFPKPHGNLEIERKTLDAGRHLFRLHPSLYQGNGFNNTLHGDARFSPIGNSVTQRVIPTLYAGESTAVAICEVLFHDVDVSQSKIVFAQKNLIDKSHSELILQQDLVVARIDHTSVVKMRAGKKLIHCEADEYAFTREWAEHIYQQHADIQGLEWPSRQHQGNAWVFFGDRIQHGALAIVDTRAVIHDRKTLEILLRLAARMNIVID
ncbi:RES family NAD+ phosphorylase [Erwinia sp. HDF1-3R]|uniref:RES family NAD+ phosphorylase n=1 Tax=Erwinia sp. HDF1-3R TaxID=3141543 RepID=UPI0031F561C8